MESLFYTMKKTKKKQGWANPSALTDDSIIRVLEKDFQELNSYERQLLRNLHTRKFGTQTRITENEMLTVYLREKRKRVTELERVVISTKRHTLQGTFGCTGYADVSVIPVVTAPDGPQAGLLHVDESIMLPLLTASYFDDNTEVWCLTPSGDFCRVTSREFDVRIV